MTGLPASLRDPAQARRAPRRSGLGVTKRLDRWWVAPGVQGALFTICATYLFISGILLTPLFGTPYEVDGYLSPLFSPLIAPEWLPTLDQSRAVHPVDPARVPGHLLLLPEGVLPLLLRGSARLRGRRADGPSALPDGGGIAVHPPERAPVLPVPRVRPALLPVGRRRPRLADDDGQWRIGLGLVILSVNAALLTGYSLSCHSLRHLVGGRLDCFSCTRRTQARYSMWQRLTCLNRNHMSWAWASLISVTLADVYIRLLALGVITDPAILF